ncbi:MAG: DUF4252 domain-containing protein [Bryobacteraceae bacterium]
MNKEICRLLLIPLAIAIDSPAQDIGKLIPWDKLAPKAIEKVDITLDSPLLQIASRFLSDKPDEAKAKKLVGGLKGIYVRSLTFEKEGEYSMKDVEAVMTQLRGSGWSRMIDVQSKREGDTAGVFFKTDGNQIGGLVVVAAEPKELTVVHILGSIDPADLKDLSGNFGIPKLDLERKQKKK